MDWEEKGQMIRLGNAMNASADIVSGEKNKDKKAEFHKFCLDNAPKFDSQAWDMFSSIVDIIIDEIGRDVEFWKQLWPEFKKVDGRSDDFGMRSGMRILMLQNVCRDHLGLKG